MSLYGDYIKEREDKEIIEDQYGFATFVFLPEHCYIVDIYVKPEFRKQNIASKYADQITVMARERGYSKLLGSVAMKAHGVTTSLRVLLAYGFKLQESNADMIYLVKEI